uniref:Uncharacterized protein n=1 Tax=Ditylenchus dipsaci TaxID=166011 RepID=A0A915DZU6_9BILA
MLLVRLAIVSSNPICSLGNYPTFLNKYRQCNPSFDKKCTNLSNWSLNSGSNRPQIGAHKPSQQRVLFRRQLSRLTSGELGTCLKTMINANALEFRSVSRRRSRATRDFLEKGLKGESGKKGEIGRSGEMSLQGENGANGAPGIQGLEAIIGEKGRQGEVSVGNQEHQDLKVKEGNDGEEGPKGDPGMRDSQACQ